MKTKKKKYLTATSSVYQMIAEKYDSKPDYVGLINRGIRKPTRGKGLLIKKELEKYNQKNKALWKSW